MPKNFAGQISGNSKSRPALTPDARENQIISLAMDLAEKQIRNGTASSQVITHFLQLGATKTELEKEKLRNETELLKAKKTSIESGIVSSADYEKLVNVIKTYSGKEEYDSIPDEYSGNPKR